MIIKSILRTPLIVYGYILFSQPFILKVYSDLNTNSLLNMFCLENVKAEMSRADFNYEEGFAEETCECYLRNFSESGNHDESISICKEIAKEKFNL